MRDFAVCTIEAAFTPSTGKWTQKYTNHRVLVGEKFKVQHCKEKIAEKLGSAKGEMGWTFELNEQIHEQ